MNRAKNQFSAMDRTELLRDLKKVDKQITEIMLQAEKHVGKDPLFQSFWSTQISQLQIMPYTGRLR